MPRRIEQVHITGRPYHVTSRAIEGRQIFDAKEDCSRFLFQMYAANIGSPVPNIHRHDMTEITQSLLKGGDEARKLIRVEHEPLVEFFSFVLVGDHYHLGIVPTIKEGISKYMQKLNLGFAKYYNLKHERRGSLFETRFRVAPIKTPRHLQALVHHINIKNVLDAYEPEWHTKGIDDHDDAVQFLKEYPYSSFPDIFQERASVFLPLLARQELKKFIKIKGEKSEIQEILGEYLENQNSGFKHIFLE